MKKTEPFDWRKDFALERSRDSYARNKHDPEFIKRNRAKAHSYYHKNKTRVLHLQRVKKYGVTPEAYDTMFTSQGNACAICKSTEAQRWCVDHCHNTKKVRGILCSPCNLAIGHLRNSPTFLRAAADYLEGNHETSAPATAAGAVDGGHPLSDQKSNARVNVRGAGGSEVGT